MSKILLSSVRGGWCYITDKWGKKTTDWGWCMPGCDGSLDDEDLQT